MLSKGQFGLEQFKLKADRAEFFEIEEIRIFIGYTIGRGFFEAIRHLEFVY
jgi:hypothetical protein